MLQNGEIILRSPSACSARWDTTTITSFHPNCGRHEPRPNC